MKIVIPGGSGQLGALLVRELERDGHEVVVLSRGAPAVGRHVPWDGKSAGAWTAEVDGSDCVINLAGRSVNCRYTEANLAEMMNSRTDSTRAVGAAIAAARHPPPVWLQMSTATLYAHRFDAANDEATGILGGAEPDAPAYWKRSVDIATAWEDALASADTPHTRKVALRTAMVMEPAPGGVFDVLLGLVRKRLGGPIAGGRQWVSWIHGTDFARAVRFLLDRPDLDGAVNLAAPHPVPQRDFMAALRDAAGVSLGLPAAAWMVKVGAVFMRTDAELVLKSRRVVPTRLLDAGFRFEHERWPDAARQLVEARRAL